MTPAASGVSSRKGSKTRENSNSGQGIIINLATKRTLKTRQIFSKQESNDERKKKMKSQLL